MWTLEQNSRKWPENKLNQRGGRLFTAQTKNCAAFDLNFETKIVTGARAVNRFFLDRRFYISRLQKTKIKIIKKWVVFNLFDALRPETLVLVFM